MSKVYCGRRIPGKGIVTVQTKSPEPEGKPENKMLKMRQDLVMYPGALSYDWGKTESHGTFRLALALLADFLNDEDVLAKDLHVAFRQALIEPLGSTWTLEGEVIEAWIKKRLTETPELRCPSCKHKETLIVKSYSRMEVDQPLRFTFDTVGRVDTWSIDDEKAGAYVHVTCFCQQCLTHYPLEQLLKAYG